MPAPQLPRGRVYSVDVLRGLIMIIMALDHVRDFFHVSAMTQDPLDAQTTTPMLYFTRWVTHFCAPLFVLLSGLSVRLMHTRKSTAEICRFLLTRGLWLILIEVTVVSLALTFNPLLNVMILQVIWAIGIGFLFLALLVWLPWQAVLGLGILITAGHNLLDYVQARPGFQPGALWEFAHKTRYNFYELFPGHGVIVIYPFLPWVGIMLLGYGIGRVFEADVSAGRRQKLLITIGIAMLAVFVVLRGWNIYGDPDPWAGSFYAFMNVEKYPPSLLYACATIGPGLLMLAALEHTRNRVTEVAKVYGSVPFFYYILHFYLIHGLCVAAFFISGYGVNDIVTPNQLFLFRPPAFGYPLWAVYLIWIAVVAILYRPCRWYSQYKQTHRQWWLSYL